MAGLGDIARAFGYSVTSGLGTAEEQRTRADKLRAAEEERKHRADVLAETRRGHDLQYQQEDIAALARSLGIPVEGGGPIMVSRGNVGSALSALAARQKPKTERYGDVLGEAEMYGLDLAPRPIMRTEAIPAEAARLDPEAVGERTFRDRKAEQARLDRQMPLEAAKSLRGTFPELLKRKREDSEKQTKVARTREAIALYRKTGDLDAVREEYSDIPAADIRADKPEKPAVHFGQSGEVLETTPGKPGVTTKRPGQPDEGKGLTLEYQKLRNEQMKRSAAAQSNAASIEERIAAKDATIAEKELSQAIAELSREANANRAAARAADEAENFADKDLFSAFAVNLQKRAAELDRYRQQRITAAQAAQQPQPAAPGAGVNETKPGAPKASTPKPAAPPASGPSAMSTMPPPAQHKGRTIRDLNTGLRYKSDGTRWVEVK